MRFEGDIQMEEHQNWTYEDYEKYGRPCHFVFLRRKVTNYKTDYHNPERIMTITTTTQNLFRKQHVIDYLHARLVISNIGYIISRTRYFIKEEVTEDYRKKKRVITCKRMVTKISNAINKFEEDQHKLLLPNFEDPGYIKAKTKLHNYKTELETLLKP